MRAAWLAVLVLGLTACGDATDRVGSAQESSPTGDSLDSLALESGALPDSVQVDPAGRYGRRYDGGSDSLCLVPDGGARGRYRFGAETRIGQDEYCRGAGRAKLSADKLLLNFEGAQCTIVARYEGDEIVFPGGLDAQCGALCSSRGSFAGVSFPRIDRDVAAARQMRDRRKAVLCR